VNSENHDAPAPDAESRGADAFCGKAIKLYQKVGILEYTEDEMIVKYTPLVIKLVHQIAPMTRSVVDFEDLKNVGYFALVQSVRSFNPTLGVAFEVHCRTRIRGAILDELRKNYPVPRSIYSKWKKLERTIQEQEEKLGRPPTEAELATLLEISVDEYRELLDELRPVAYVSLDEISSPSESEDFSPFQAEDINQVDPAGQVAALDLQELIRNRLHQMSPQQQKILAFYYYEGLRFKDIAMLLSLSESRVCQIHTEAILALRAYLDRKESLVNN